MGSVCLRRFFKCDVLYFINILRVRLEGARTFYNTQYSPITLTYSSHTGEGGLSGVRDGHGLHQPAPLSALSVWSMGCTCGQLEVF